MAQLQGIIGPVAEIIDKVVHDPDARDRALLDLLQLGPRRQTASLHTQLSAILARAQPPDPWTSRARPAFLYVMYALLLWAIPMGVIAGIRPELAQAIAQGMTAYLNGLPEPLYALFGTGYLGYTAARTWGKTKGVDR